MRVDIIHPGAGELQYEIRGIVEFAHKIEKTGVPIFWENIGDPIAKGEQVPEWITDIVAKAAKESLSYAYSPTKGLNDARNFLSKTRSHETGAELLPENIIFFNGLGDAITKVYTWLNPIARVLGPSPAYPTHSSVEGAHGRSRHLTYNLDPENNWLPDIEDIKNKVTHNPNIAALLLINPDNPTGMVYPREILEAFVAIAKEHDLFLIADEIYANLTYEADSFISLAALSDGVPTMVMRGLSKEVPWPGGRCGWLEFYNLEKDDAFKRYVLSIEEAKMIEVCSTTLPQMVLPEILSDSRYQKHLRDRSALYEKRAEIAVEPFKNVPAATVIKPKGAFYLTVALSEEFLSSRPTLAGANPEAQALLDEELAKIPEDDKDKRFCYELLALSGICTVPLTSGFNSHIPGFRMTLLESDDYIFNKILKCLTEALLV